MISDLDFIFSFLLMNELTKHGGIHIYFLCAIIVGLITYFVGVTYYGPSQKYKTMLLVMELMQTNPELFVPEGASGLVRPLTADDATDPSSKHGTKFKDVPKKRGRVTHVQSGPHNKELGWLVGSL
jgi:hypothetical protein